MKKAYFKLLTLFTLLLCITFTGCSKPTNSSLTTVRLNEVTRSIFYAPMYVAIKNGYFKENGINLDLSTGEGADKTMQQVLSKSADIGFCGPEQVIYIYNKHRKDYPIVFAKLTQKDGSFLVGRHENKSFTWKSLKGKTVIGGRPGGVPEMAFEYALKSNGLKPGKDVNIITNINFSSVGGAFKGGTGDYATLFEPTGSLLEQSNAGYINASVGTAAGYLPYTCFFTTKSYINQNPKVIQGFTNAIYKGQLWMSKHSDQETASLIKSFFPGSSTTLIQNSIKNYKNIDAYASNPLLKEEEMNRFMDIIQSYDKDLIKTRPAFNTITNEKFAKEAIKNIK
ncbi:nitrate ABC transporter substrate-binding protein [Clostridium acetobutylicum]|nr:nitrate ABC transporter substrate-binding protein [Clostridium acetobutylicum]